MAGQPRSSGGGLPSDLRRDLRDQKYNQQHDYLDIAPIITPVRMSVLRNHRPRMCSALSATLFSNPQPLRPKHQRIFWRSSPRLLPTQLRQRLQSTIAREPHLLFRRDAALTIEPAEAAHSTPPPPPRRRSLLSRIAVSLAAGTLCFSLSFLTMAADAIPTAVEVLNPPTDAETLQLWQPDPESRAGQLEAELQAHPLVAALRKDAALSESRPHMRIPAAMRANNFTGGTLLKEDMLEVPALVFGARDGSRMVSIHYVGRALCGHPGIVHGGLLSTLLDEGLARCCFPALPNRIAVTASLSVTFKVPCYADQFIVLRADTTRVDGRKAWVTGRLETLVDESKGETPLVLDEAEGLFIEPKGAKHMAKIYTEPRD